MFDWLKGILPENININFSPSLNINNIKLNSDNTNSQPVTLDGKTLVLNDSTPDGKKIIAQFIKELPQHLEHNDIALEDTNLDSLNVIDSEIKTSNYDAELEKYKKLVTKKDIPILEVAILISLRFKKHENISSLKSQVVQRFGARAAMICNLYSSGYFDSLIMPLFESYEKGDLAIDEYANIYEMIVTESPLAMFVGEGTTRPRAKSLLLEKIKLNKNAEVGYLNIHGIGTSNITLIKSLLNDDEIKDMFTEEPTIDLIDKSIKATIFI